MDVKAGTTITLVFMVLLQALWLSLMYVLTQLQVPSARFLIISNDYKACGKTVQCTCNHK